MTWKFRCLLAITLCAVTAICLAKPSLSFEIEGIKDKAAADNAQNRLQIEAKATSPLTTQAIRSVYEKGSENILEALKPYGLLKAKITKRKLSHEGDKWTAYYYVKPGRPLRVTALNLQIQGQGKKDKKIEKTLQHLPLKKGHVFKVPDYNATKNKLLSKAEARGYIKARFSKDSILIDRKAYTCVINLTLKTGHRYYFGLTHFNKNPLSEQFLKRYLTYQQGHHFSSEKLLTLQNDLSSAGYYQGVGVTPEVDQAVNYQIPVKVHLTPYKKKRYQFGLGYGTASGPRVTAGVKWRWVNSDGHRFNANLNWSRVIHQISAQYIIPGKNPANDQYSLNAAVYTLDPQHGHAFVKKFGVGQLKQQGQWQRNINLNYILETYKVDSEQGTQNAHMLLPSLSYTYLSTNKLFNIKHGIRLDFIMEGAYKGLLSSVSFLQGEFRFKTVQTLWKDNRFVIRGDVGYTLVKNLPDLPLSERYYTGGPTSVRGYANDSMGPGRYLTVGSVEYQRRIVGNWFGAVFYDAGNAFNDFTNYSSNLERSTGVGAVWQSPVGNISLYIAKALTKKGQPIRLEFSLGPEL